MTEEKQWVISATPKDNAAPAATELQIMNTTAVVKSSIDAISSPLPSSPLPASPATQVSITKSSPHTDPLPPSPSQTPQNPPTSASTTSTASSVPPAAPNTQSTPPSPPPLQHELLTTPPSQDSQIALTTTSQAAPAAVAPGILAGIAKSLATKSAFAMTAFGKGLLKWWFRFPIKLFRPHIVNPWLVLGKMAEQEGTRLSAQYVRGVVAVEGLSVLGNNMLPLLFANACAGAILFNVYGLTADYLATPTLHFHHPFIAGTLAGASTALIATPIDNIRARIDPLKLVQNRQEGVLRFTYRTVKEVLPHSVWERTKILYKGVGFTAFKDGLGFGMFFGTFEGLRKIGKGVVSDFFGTSHTAKSGHYQGFGNEREHPLPPSSSSSTPPQQHQKHSLPHTIANSFAVITAGATAGMAYQLVIYPIDNIPAVVAAHKLKAVMDPVTAERVASAVAPSYAEDGFHNNNFRSAGAASGTASTVTVETVSVGEGVGIKVNGGTYNGQTTVPSFTWREVWNVVRSEGVRPFYRGIAPQLVRVMPPSAVGLFAYEVASSQLWDDD